MSIWMGVPVLASRTVAPVMLSRKNCWPLSYRKCEYVTRYPNRRNVEILREAGARFIGPVTGAQACGDEGEGRMTEPADILDRLEGIFAEPVLAGRRVLVTAGPTFEALDAVRGITNRSSGRQGWDLARAARDAGAEVTLVAGPTALRTPEGVRRIDVVSALEMHATVLGELERSSSEGHPYDLFFGVAAVYN